MKDIDFELINAKIDIIEKNLNLLKEISNEEEENFISNFRDIQAAKHSLQESIESCIDISNHIISSNGFQRAETYSEIFEILSKKKIIPEKLSKKLQDMSKFRNLLVHQYGKVDEEELYSIMKEDLKDIEEFVKTILKLNTPPKNKNKFS